MKSEWPKNQSEKRLYWLKAQNSYHTMQNQPNLDLTASAGKDRCSCPYLTRPCLGQALYWPWVSVAYNVARHHQGRPKLNIL
ncbi:MAG TPA: hypothetical protein VIM29_04960 [Bacillota bacterium]